MPTRVTSYVGNRGIVLVLLGIIWALTGVGMMVEAPKKLGLPDDYLPISVRIAAWLLPAIVALIAVFVRRLDGWAWGLLMLPVAMRLLSFSWGWATGTYATAWRGTFLYLAVGLLIDRCAAGLDRPPPWDGRERRWIPKP